MLLLCFFFVKQKTAYEMRISDWSSDVCSSDLATAKPNRAASRSAARLAAVQALYQHEMEATKLPVLLTELHNHRLGAEIEDEQYHDAEVAFFDDLVTGVDARRTEIDAQIVTKIAGGWTIEGLGWGEGRVGEGGVGQ